QVAQRARRDDAVRARVERVRHMTTGLAERRRATRGDDREAAALVAARVPDRRRAARLYHPLQVLVAVGVELVAEPARRSHDVAAVEGPHPEILERPDHALAKGVEADLLDEQPQQVLV